MYEDLNFKIRGGWALTYPVLYQLRFLAISGIVVFWGGFLVFQV